MVYIMTAVLTAFFTSHYVFRWRTAMNDFYVEHWQRLRHIEGASQRIQDDTQRFAETVEGLGSSLVQALMTLIAFLPILWGLSSYVKELPVVGPGAAGAGVRRRDLGGARHRRPGGGRRPAARARRSATSGSRRPTARSWCWARTTPRAPEPPTLRGLFADVRANYFRLYANFLYFNVVRYGYLQAGVLVPYIALAPSIVAGGLTLGVMQQTTRAFGRVEESFQYLVRSWTTIVSLLSIYKRLRAFEATLRDEPLDGIEAEPIRQAGCQVICRGRVTP